MANVREVTFGLLRSLGMTTVFGNPGSTELPFLQYFPSDFTFVLGLQEASVVATADGYAQASGRAALVNLHTAAGLGNAMGTVVTAFHNHAPLLITAGQQHRAMIAQEPLLLARDATLMPKPYVKWSYEPARAEDVPRAFLRAYHVAMQNPRGPVFLSIPMDDWDAEVEPVAPHTVGHRVAPEAGTLQAVAALLQRAEHPALVLGAGVDRAGGWDAAVALAERLRAAVWQAPLAGRVSFPGDHPLYQGFLPPSAGLLAPQLAGHDVVLVAGAPVFTYYPYVPGPTVPPGTRLAHLTDDPDEAAWAPVGTSVVGDVALSLEALVALLPEAQRAAPPPRPAPAPAPASAPISPAYVFTALARTLPADGIVVHESPSNTAIFYDYVPIHQSGGYYTAASGALGYALPAAVGVQLAQPDRRVVCLLGDGSSMYSVQGLWTAAHYHLPVTFLVLENGQYAILKWFAAFERVGPGIPGLDLPGLDLVQIARGCGLEAERVTIADELAPALERALGSGQPRLIAVPIDPGVPTVLSPGPTGSG